MTTLKNEEIVTLSEEETENLAAKLAKGLSGGTVIALHGDLGAGKTVFARGLARALGIMEPVTSPTFTVVQEYETGENAKIAGIRKFYHIDLYRIDDEFAALAFGIDEFLNVAEAVTVVEWSEKIEKILPRNTIDLFIVYKGKNKRSIRMEGNELFRRLS